MSSHLQWTSVLLQSLYRSGVRHVVISPGSRSTPITVAASIHPKLRNQVVLDERSAGYIALGIGKATGIPAVLICTSGTAAANYFPAIVEAKESGIPLIVITADRPPNLRGIGSSQTIDQTKLFGDQVVLFHDTGEPRFEDSDLKRLDYLGRQSVKKSIDFGGAVHINMPFRKPLEPDSSEIEQVKVAISDAIENEPVVEVSSNRTIYLNKRIENLINASKRPLIVAGPANPHHSFNRQISEFSSRLNSPVVAEPGSDVHGLANQISRFEQFLRNRNFQNDLKPDLLIRFGDQPFTKSLLSALENWSDVPVIHFSSRNAIQDHTMSITHTVSCQSNDHIEWPQKKHSTSTEWVDLWKKADHTSQLIISETLSESKVLTDGVVFGKISDQIRPGWNVMLSNSFIPRDMSLFGQVTEQQYVNRGAAGIDGITSTAIGIHSATNKPTLCITGDLAFLHDSNALLSIKQSEKPFVVIVINNGGGTIFKMLPIHDNKELFSDYFETPQKVIIESLVKAHQIEYHKITSIAEMAQFDLNSVTSSTIFECITDAEESMSQRNKLWKL